MRGSECFGVTRNDRERVNALGIVFPHAGNLVDSVVELWLAAAYEEIQHRPFFALDLIIRRIMCYIVVFLNLFIWQRTEDDTPTGTQVK